MYMISILPQILLNALIAAGIYAVLALGFTLSYRVNKFFDLSYGIFATIAGYSAWTLMHFLQWNFFISSIVAILIAAAISLLCYIFVYSRLSAKKSSHMVMLVASIGVMTVIQSVIAMLATSQFQTLTSGQLGSTHQIFGAFITDVQIVGIGSGIVVYCLLVLVLRYSRYGRAIRAIGDDADVAAIVGINTVSIYRLVAVLSGAIAGLAGVLVAFDTGIEPLMGMNLMLKATIVAIIGGVGSIRGAIVGAIFLALVENIAIWQLSGEWKDTVAFLILILVLLVRPSGIMKPGTL
jgi:branched-chain amino acid transport system permease protein